MEGSTTLFVVLALLGAGACVIAFVVQEILRQSAIGVARLRLEAILDTVEAVVHDRPRPAGPSHIEGPWGERGPQSVEEARSGLLTTLAEMPVEFLAADQKLWLRTQRVLVLIDSCQSGATVEAFAEMQNFQRRYIRSFSRVAGVTVIAASRRDQQAIELPSLGHGLFTYVVLQGLDGNADSSPRDGSVTAHEIVEYADLQIPGMSKRYLDEPQVPMAFALGADFRLQGN